MKTKAAVLYRMGLPAPYAESKPLVIDDVELAGPGEGEVLVEVVAAGLCHSDLSVIDGSRPRVMPMLLGHEAAGIVRELGPGVRSVAAGDHVVFSFVPLCGRCPMCAGGRAALCENGSKANAAGTLLTGQRRLKNRAGEPLNHHLGVSGFAQFTVAATESLVRIDADMPFEKAALFGCAVMTGVGAVVNTAKVEAGAAVVIVGLGGVGLSAVMGAKAAGAGPIVAVDRLESKLALALKLGASHAVLVSEARRVSEGARPATSHGSISLADASGSLDQIRSLTDGGAHYAFECAGHPDALALAYAATRRGGTTIAVGLPSPKLSFSLPHVNLVADERTLKGSFMGSCIPSRDVPRFMAMHRAGLLPIDALHTHTLALDDVNAGMDALASGQAVRQIIRFSG
jgi:alcohol dehydrogenase